MRERVGWEARRQRARGGRERDLAHVDALLDEPRHRPAGAELAVVGVRREHEGGADRVDHRFATCTVPSATLGVLPATSSATS